MIPRHVGSYRLDRMLGSGGMGEVYKAYDTQRDRYIGLKLLPEAFSGDQEYVERFQRESLVAARLQEPHVIPIHDFGEIDGQLFIDMYLVDGADIGALLDANGRIEPQRAAYLISQVAQALDAAHADDLVHGDIKPSNILVTEGDFVYVVDFGIARPVGHRQASLAITGETIGTLHYMAPERFAGHDVDGRADVYSLACVLYECLTGEPPFKGKDLPALLYAQLYSSPPHASSLADGVPPALDAVIARGMAKDPADRFPTAGMLAAAVREALPAEAPTPPMAEMERPAWVGTPTPVWEAATVGRFAEDVAGDLADDLAGDLADDPARTVMAAGADDQGGAWPPGYMPQGASPIPAWGAATVGRFAEDVAGDLADDLAGDLADDLADDPARTVMAAGADDQGGAWPPGYMPQGASPDPGGSRLPPGVAPGRPARGPAWRRRGVLIPAAAAALAVPVALVLIAFARPGAGSAPATPGTGGATRTGAAGAPSSTPSATASITVPTVAGKVQVGESPSYIQVAPNGKFAYVANPGAGAIIVLNTADDLVSGIINIPQGPPQFVSFSPDSRTAYVSVYNRHASVHLIAFIDTTTSTVTATVPVNNYTPGPSATSPDGRYLYVPNHNMAVSGSNENVVDVINTASKKLVGKIAVPANPHWVVFGKNDRFYTSDHLSGIVTVLNGRNNDIIAEIKVGETPHSEAMSPDGSRLAVTSFSGNEVFLVNTVTDQVAARIPVGRNPLNVAYSPDGRYLYTVDHGDNAITVIDTTDNRVIGEVPTGKAPTSISVLPNGRQAYVSDENDGSVEILNIAQ